MEAAQQTVQADQRKLKMAESQREAEESRERGMEKPKVRCEVKLNNISELVAPHYKNSQQLVRSQ